MLHWSGACLRRALRLGVRMALRCRCLRWWLQGLQILRWRDRETSEVHSTKGTATWGACIVTLDKGYRAVQDDIAIYKPLHKSQPPVIGPPWALPLDCPAHSSVEAICDGGGPHTRSQHIAPVSSPRATITGPEEPEGMAAAVMPKHIPRPLGPSLNCTKRTLLRLGLVASSMH